MLLDYAVAGDHVLLDDGKLEFEVVRIYSGIACGDQASANNWAIECRTLRGGVVKSGKSMAIVGKELPMPTLTESDVKNIGLAAEYGVTGVMQPFVRGNMTL